MKKENILLSVFGYVFGGLSKVGKAALLGMAFWATICTIAYLLNFTHVANQLWVMFVVPFGLVLSFTSMCDLMGISVSVELHKLPEEKREKGR